MTLLDVLIQPDPYLGRYFKTRTTEKDIYSIQFQYSFGRDTSIPVRIDSETDFWPFFFDGVAIFIKFSYVAGVINLLLLPCGRLKSQNIFLLSFQNSEIANLQNNFQRYIQNALDFRDLLRNSFTHYYTSVFQPFSGSRNSILYDGTFNQLKMTICSAPFVIQH